MLGLGRDDPGVGEIRAGLETICLQGRGIVNVGHRQSTSENTRSEYVG